MFGILTNKDLRQIGDIFDEKINSTLDKKLDEKLDYKLEKLEERLENKLENKFDEKLGSFAIILKEHFDRIDNRFDRLENKFDKLSFTVNQNHDRRIEILEDNMRVINNKLSIQ